MFAMNDFQLSIMKQRYALPTEDSWDDVSSRVAKHLAAAETNGDMKIWETRFKWAMNNGYFFPGGRTLYGSGRRIGGLLNCFCKGVEDNRHSIAKLSHDMYLISTFGGGVGTNYSKIRPKGDYIQGVAAAAPGVVSEIRKIDAIGEQVRSGGNRRTALIATLDVEHPDLLEFLDVKLDRGELNNHNISINFSRDFLNAVKKDKDWHFTFGGKKWNLYKFNRVDKDEFIIVHGTTQELALKIAEAFYKVHYTDSFEFVEEVVLKARDIWDRIVKNAVNSGEPGFLFIDNIKDNFVTSYFETYSNVNPCTEAVLPSDGNCCLGSLNLGEFYDSETNDVDWKLLGKVVRIAIRALDNVLTMNIYPIPETKVCAEASRRIGLGVMGLHHLLIKLGFRYGDEKSLEFIERLFATIRNEAFDASIELAKEKGSFQEYDYDEYVKNQYIQKLPSRLLNKMRKYGIRNAVILSIAPTGTISMCAGTSSGIEPIFAPILLRRYRTGNVNSEEVVIDKMFESAVASGDGYSHIVGAYDVTPEEHLAVQAAVQDYVDQAISKTINLPETYDFEELSKIVLDFSDRLKGMTVYRAGSRGQEPLTPIPTTQANISKYLLKTEDVSTVGSISQECSTGSCEL